MKRTEYATNLNSAEWTVIQETFPRKKKHGSTPEYTKRSIVNAILYIISARKHGTSRQMAFLHGKQNAIIFGHDGKVVFGKRYLTNYVNEQE